MPPDAVAIKEADARARSRGSWSSDHGRSPRCRTGYRHLDDRTIAIIAPDGALSSIERLSGHRRPVANVGRGALRQTAFTVAIVRHQGGQVRFAGIASLHSDMSQTIRAGLFYFAVVLGAGFILGMFRVPFVVPRIGERWAELAEMPIMAAVIYFAAGYLLRRYPDIRSPTRSLAAGFLALALTVAAELGLATVLQNRTLAEFVGSRDKVSGSVYIALLLAFAVMPRLRLSSHGARVHEHDDTAPRPERDADGPHPP